MNININIHFIIKASILYGILAASFSLIGIFLPMHHYLDNPLTGGLNAAHITGHIVWGLMAGAATLSLRYFLLAGSFAILIDLDHLIALLNIEAIGRMGHSIPFGVLSAVIMMFVFGRKDYLLGAVAFAGMLAHISFDTLSGAGNFPLFAPFYDGLIRFPNADWVFFQLAAVIMLGLIMMQTKRQSLQNKVS